MKREFERKIEIIKKLLNELNSDCKSILEQKEKLIKRLYRISIKDELTGLYNRYYIIDRLEKEIQRAFRENSGFYLVLLDLDNFKKINDFYGHLEGDRILKKVANILKKYFRNYDVLSRFGGDEFLILILSNVNIENIKSRLEKIRKEIEMLSPETRLSVSYGIIHFPKDIRENYEFSNNNVKELVKLLIQKVDTLMYKDKKSHKSNEERNISLPYDSLKKQQGNQQEFH